MSTPTFKLGITMAGAVSAGAYTAGFIDYLIEVLELWEEKKQQNRTLGKDHPDYDKRIPMHDVCIDAFGGASAGGMVGMITALSTFSKMPPVKEPSDVKTGNILYDSWVLLDDDVDPGITKKVATFEKMLRTDDFDSHKDGIPSLLNSQPIDRIADKVFNELVPPDQKRPRPAYISEDLRVLLTLCSLRGVPFELNFKNFVSANFPYSPGHRMNEHMIIAHFKMKYDEAVDKDVYLKFDPYDADSRELLKLCTKATGAFPVGLAPRHFDGKLSTAYIKNGILRNLEIENKDAIEIKIDTANFDFTDIDGGTINNEPYSEVVQVLEEVNEPYNKELPMFGTIMVDPFPNFYNQDEAVPVKDIFSDKLFQKSIWDVIPKAYSTLREQVRVKHSGSFYKNYLRLLVFPVKWKGFGELSDHPPLSCAALGGFGGFFNIEFRKHDFFLGRNNARNFLRAYLMLEHDTNRLHPLFKDLTDEAFAMFKRTPRKNNPERKSYVPIIPDLNLIEDRANDNTDPFTYTYEGFPKIQEAYFDTIKGPLKNRLKKMLTYEINNRFKKKRGLRFVLKLVRGNIAKRATKKIIQVIKDDFKERNMM